MNLFVVGALALIVFSLSYKNKAVDVIRTLPAGIGYSGGKMIVKIKIFNPSNSTFTVNSIIGDVYVSGKLIGIVSKLGLWTLQPNSYQTIDLIVSANVGGLTSSIINTITSVINKTALPSSVKVKLTINAEGLLRDSELTF